MSINRVLRFTAFILMPAMFGNNLAFAAKRPLDVAAVRAKIQSEGVGRGVLITRVDKTEVKGVIASIGEQSFVLAPKSKGQSETTTIEYAQVAGIRRHKITTGDWVLLGAVGVGAAIGIAAFVEAARFNSFGNVPLPH